MTTPKLSRLILLFTLLFLVGCFAIADFEIKNEFDPDASTDADGDSDSDIDRDSGDALDAEADSDVRIDADSDRCGDGVCRDGETVETCEVDCPSQCGDGLCTHDERFATCCRDCESECGDRICSSDEAASGSCDQDCLTRWVRICAGSFVMGSPVSEVDRRTDEEQHVVTLTRDFAILSTEVTQQEYIDVIGEIPFDFPGCSNCPAETVSWHDAARYCNGIEEDDENCYDCEYGGEVVTCQVSSAYDSIYDCPGYRLPTEAEWEYAARAGTVEPLYGPIDDIAWNGNNSSRTTHIVGTRAPNAFGLHDMIGNVQEWTNDWYEPFTSEERVDPTGPSTAMDRVFRGGSWFHREIRTASRVPNPPSTTINTVGLRPVRSVILSEE